MIEGMNHEQHGDTVSLQPSLFFKKFRATRRENEKLEEYDSLLSDILGTSDWLM